MPTSAHRKRVALIGIPDDALDVLNHFTQSSEWEPAVVVSDSFEDYAVRMAEVLGVAVAANPDRNQLAKCDLVIVGANASGGVESIRSLLSGTVTEVSTVEEVTESLGIHLFQDPGARSGREAASNGLDGAAFDIENALEGLGGPRAAPHLSMEPESSDFWKASREPEEAYTIHGGDPRDDEAIEDEEAAGDEDGFGADPGFEAPADESGDEEDFVDDAVEGASGDESPVGYTVEELDPSEDLLETDMASAMHAMDGADEEAEDETLPETAGNAEAGDYEEPFAAPVAEAGADETDDLPAEDAPAGQAPAGETGPDDDTELAVEPAPAPAPALRRKPVSLEGRLTAGAVLPIKDGDEALTRLLHDVLERTGAKTGSFMVPIPGEDRLRIIAAVGLAPQIVAETRPRIGEGIAGASFASGKPKGIRAEIPDLAELGTALRHRLAASHPLLLDGRTLGVLSVNVESSDAIDEETVLGVLAEHEHAAVGCLLEAIDLPRLDLETRSDFLLGRLDAILGTDAPFPTRLREVSALLRRAVGADYAHLYLVDTVHRRLELSSSSEGMATGGTSLPLDRGFLGWVAGTDRVRLVPVSGEGEGTERAFACLPVRANGPYALIVLEQFEIPENGRSGLDRLLNDALSQLEEIFELEQGVESQDVLSGLMMRIADRSSQIEALPDGLRAQATLDFTVQILAAEAAVWLPTPGERPVIAQPHTRQAARILADAWDELETLADGVRRNGSAVVGGRGKGWEPGTAKGTAPYAGVKDLRGEGVLLALFTDTEEAGPPAQLPARLLLETLKALVPLIPASGEPDSSDRRVA